MSLFSLLRSPAKPLALLQRYRKYKQEVSPAPVNTWHGLQQLEPRLLLNADPTGSVTITGSYIEDQVLTASNTLADEDGLGAISYQWNRRSHTQPRADSISSATADTYRLTQEDVGKTITVTAYYTDDQGNNESVVSVPKLCVVAWGEWGAGVIGAPINCGFVYIASTDNAFAGLKEDGSITAWGDAQFGGSGAPTDSGYTQIFSTDYAFAALKEDGSITAWGHRYYGGSQAPNDSGYIQIFSMRSTFVALKTDGSLTAWGDEMNKTPKDSGYINVEATTYAFAALKEDGSITAWGHSCCGGSGAPTDNGYTEIFSARNAFSALRFDGTINAWGKSDNGGSRNPIDSGYTKIFSNHYAFAALKPEVVVNINDIPTGSISISGTLIKGYQLAAINTLVDEDGLGEIFYQWNRNGNPIPEATTDSYTLTQEDVSTYITVASYYTDKQGTDEIVTSEVVFIVDASLSDANQDGVVDIADLGTLGANFNKTNAQWTQGDFNGDGVVDVADLGIIGANWGTGNTVSALANHIASNNKISNLGS